MRIICSSDNKEFRVLLIILLAKLHTFLLKHGSCPSLEGVF